MSSIAIGTDERPIISHHDYVNGDLRVTKLLAEDLPAPPSTSPTTLEPVPDPVPTLPATGTGGGLNLVAAGIAAITVGALMTAIARRKRDPFETAS